MSYGYVSFSDWIEIELLDPVTKKVVSTLVFDGEDSMDGRLVAGSPGCKLSVIAVIPKFSAYQQLNSWGLK